jgi:ABC-type multidrug transport system ATPase subunit
VLITTHFMDEAEFCDRLGLISGGRLIALGAPASLKRAAEDEELFEINLAVFRGAREKLEGLAGLRNLAYFGQSLHCFCAPGAWTAAGLADAIRARGLEVRAVTPAPVSLEDAFLRLVEKKSAQ